MNGLAELHGMCAQCAPVVEYLHGSWTNEHMFGSRIFDQNKEQHFTAQLREPLVVIELRYHALEFFSLR